jgi:DNA repair protein RecN (Recombination protein N)
LDALDRAKRKYGSTIEALLEHAEEARSIVAEFEGKDARTAELTRAVAAARATLDAAAGKLSKLRAASAKRLCAAVMNELKDLALASARFDVAIEPLERTGADGAETLEFLFAANAGENLRPLARVASGGELSRVLLALVVALASTRERVALIFDEIDAGIGGATATAVGARLGRLAQDGQVMCVTHLAQLATWANRHYSLEKNEKRGTTTIFVREVAGDDARAAELARMLSGEPHAAALEHARTLLKAAK